MEPPAVESFREEFAPDQPALEQEDWSWVKTRQAEAPPPPSWASQAENANWQAKDSSPKRGATKDTSPDSPGYYSVSPERADDVRIPPAPRVPRLDLEAAEIESERERPTIPMDVFDMEHSGVTQSPLLDHAETVPAPSPEEEFPERESSPIWRTRRSSSHPPESAHGAYFRARVGYERSSSRPPAPVGPERASPRIYFSAHVRQQANEWARTGSLSLPGCSSPRHARAVQRALLLALMTEPGWDQIPQGLRQRAGWLFCEEWDTASAQGHPFREVDDLATVLSMPASGETRELLRQAVAATLPSVAMAPRASRPPPRRSAPPLRRSEKPDRAREH